MERHSTIFWTPCAAHCLDLMLEDIGKLEWVKSCVDKAKNICKFIYNHALVLNIMRDYMKKKELTRPGITKFASNFITLKSLLDSRLDLRCMFVGPEWTSSSYATTHTGIDVIKIIFDVEGFWKLCKEIVEVIYKLKVLKFNFAMFRILMIIHSIVFWFNYYVDHWAPRSPPTSCWWGEARYGLHI